MIFYQLFLYLFITCGSGSDWVSDWMNPIQSQFRDESRRNTNGDIKSFNEDAGQAASAKSYSPDSPILPKEITFRSPGNELSTASLKMKLEETLQNAKTLAESLKTQITELVNREKSLKEAVVNGRFGVSTLTVSTVNQVPRSYIIRDGHWSLCNGMIQIPVTAQGSQTNLFSELFNEPRCIGREVSTIQDPCVFNSVIKYEIVPTHRALEYAEEDYLCLKPAFNKTLERYMSVTKQVMNETCKEGVIRSLAENVVECGIRVLSEYSFYPFRSSAAASLPLEYCNEKDGSCKLITAWHISNITIENYEFLKNEHSFKKYFINTGPYIEHVI
ncbi:uncharacterized protein LOC142981427 [Anticarsia gemmatalis]|uniref:uncharacterized protein LOC142981427 n=1 Tax=Anticarsia gemmatalis TaxID=129554 RepID=UPI003F769AD5